MSTIKSINYADQRVTNFQIEAAKGNIVGFSAGHQFGANPDIDTAVEDVWEYGGTYTFLDSAATLYLSSSDSGDAQEFTVECLDENWLPVTVTKNLNGWTQTALTRPDGSALSIIRVNKMYNSDTTEPAGNVYLAQTDTLTTGIPTNAYKIKAYTIAYGAPESQQAIYSVPASHNCLVTDFFASIERASAAGAADFRLQYRLFGETFFRSLFPCTLSSSATSAALYQFPVPFFLPPKTDVKVIATGSVANMLASAGFDFILEDTSANGII